MACSNSILQQLEQPRVFLPSKPLLMPVLNVAGIDPHPLTGLYNWRDDVAREEDESPGFVLPKAQLLKLAQVRLFWAVALCLLEGLVHRHEATALCPGS